MSEILSVKNVSKCYKKKSALNNVSFTLSSGTVTGLLGPNGSGKTTLIKIINTLINDYSGEVRVCGNLLGIKSKELISYLPDVDFIRTDMRIENAINMYSDFFNDFDKVKSFEMLKVIGVERRDYIKTLSKGTKEKLQLVLTMARKASLYIFDEPVAGVDPAARDFVIGTIMNNYNDDGAILISTHLISDIEQIIDNVIFLKNGEVILTGEAEILRMENGKSIDALFREVFKCF